MEKFRIVENGYDIDEVNRFIDSYYDRYTGLYLKSKEFLNKNVTKAS